MKLLIITQKVDRNDPILGFFHNWVEEFAKHFAMITVICLEKGNYSLPENVSVYSLGKERPKVKGYKLEALRNFYKLIFRLRKEYDVVFVHMNQEYVLLAGIFWKLLRKKVFLWRNHSYGNLWTRLAIFLADRVYATSPSSYTNKFAKTRLMPAGIDTDIFFLSNPEKRDPRQVLCLGRISPVKRVEIFISSCISLGKRNIPIHALVVGSATSENSAYYKLIRDQGAGLGEAGVLEFREAVKPQETPSLYGSSEIYVNLTESGSFDKTILEAMRCGCLPVISNRSFEAIIPNEFHSKVFFRESDAESLANTIEKIFTLSEDEKEEMRRHFTLIAEGHSLRRLGIKFKEDVLLSK